MSDELIRSEQVNLKFRPYELGLIRAAAGECRERPTVFAREAVVRVARQVLATGEAGVPNDGGQVVAGD